MVQVSSKGTPRNPLVRAYYEKRKAEGKSSQQALICISRRLISIIYGMLKNGTEYRMPVVEWKMLAKMCRENGKYVVEFKLMQELALESVLFF